MFLICKTYHTSQRSVLLWNLLITQVPIGVDCHEFRWIKHSSKICVATQLHLSTTWSTYSDGICKSTTSAKLWSCGLHTLMAAIAGGHHCWACQWRSGSTHSWLPLLVGVIVEPVREKWCHTLMAAITGGHHCWAFQWRSGATHSWPPSLLSVIVEPVSGEVAPHIHDRHRCWVSLLSLSVEKWCHTLMAAIAAECHCWAGQWRSGSTHSWPPSLLGVIVEPVSGEVVPHTHGCHCWWSSLLSLSVEKWLHTLMAAIAAGCHCWACQWRSGASHSWPPSLLGVTVEPVSREVVPHTHGCHHCWVSLLSLSVEKWCHTLMAAIAGGCHCWEGQWRSGASHSWPPSLVGVIVEPVSGEVVPHTHGRHCWWVSLLSLSVEKWCLTLMTAITSGCHCWACQWRSGATHSWPPLLVGVIVEPVSGEVVPHTHGRHH